MALKSCRECKKKVSTEAFSCPSCGAPNPTFSKGSKQSFSIMKEINKGIESFKKGMEDESNKEYVPSKKKTGEDDGNIFGFWTGREGLAKTFWLYFCGGNVVGKILLNAAAAEGMGMVYFVLIVIIIWVIFATIGVFNAADIYKAEKIQQGESYGFATAAKIAVVILILSGIGNSI